MTHQKILQCAVNGIITSALVAFIAIGLASPAKAQCAGPREGGKWWSTDPKGDPISLEVTMDSCGDQVLNGQQTETSYGLKVFVLQSSGNLYQRPKVKANYQKSNGNTWLHASVPTGGYIDRIWMRRADVNGKERLYVYIKHESLDSKPSAESKLYFTRERAVQKSLGKTKITADRQFPRF